MVAPGQPPTAHAAWSHPTPQETAMNSSPSNVSSIFYESSKKNQRSLLTSAPGNTCFVYREILHSPDTMHFTCSKKLNCILLSHFGTSSLHIWQVASMLSIMAVQKWTSHLRPSLASEASRCTCHMAIKICASLATWSPFRDSNHLCYGKLCGFWQSFPVDFLQDICFLGESDCADLKDPQRCNTSWMP